MSQVAFIHGRPGPHPMHAKFAESVGADFYYVDEKMRWHDLEVNRLRRYSSWLVNALAFSRRSQYSVFMTESLHFPPMIMKQLRLLNHNQKIVALIASEALYFMRERRYSKLTVYALKQLLATYDALICVGQMEANLAREILGPGCPPVFTVFNGTPQARLSLLATVEPDLKERHLVCIANGPSGWRIWYKGVDLLLSAFKSSLDIAPDLQLTIVGSWDEDVVRELLLENGLHTSNAVRFVGANTEIHRFLQGACLYVHCGRGDAFGISVLEAMCAGVVPMVSEWTGSCEVVTQVSPQLIVPLDVSAIAQRILWYLDLPFEERAAFSNKSRDVARHYTEERATNHFAATFQAMLAEFGLPPTAMSGLNN